MLQVLHEGCGGLYSCLIAGNSAVTETVFRPRLALPIELCYTRALQVREIGGIPLMAMSIDMSNTIPDEKVRAKSSYSRFE